MFLQSIFKQFGFIACTLLFALSTSAGPLKTALAASSVDDADTIIAPMTSFPSLIKPVGNTYGSIDKALRRHAADIIRKAQSRDTVEIIQQTSRKVDSIRINENLAIHPADTLNLLTDRYYNVLKSGIMLPLIYDNYRYSPLPEIKAPDIFDLYLAEDEDVVSRAVNSLPESYYQRTLDDMGMSLLLSTRARQQMMISNPEMVEYVLADMAVAPEGFKSSVAPETRNIDLEEIVLTPTGSDKLAAVEGKPIHWIRNFQASLQFSQAYISPNWYQGGQNNLNAILNVYYNIRLNEKFYPNLLFDTTVQYKLGLNSAPEDTLHTYNVTEDLFQIYSKFGLKASNNWYYTINATFKTQLTTSYVTNRNVYKSAFMSPGELNVGLGMTYSKSTDRVQFNASIAPLSYNLRTCLSDNLTPSDFGIDHGRTSSEFGSSTELTFKWKWSYNINYSSRLFLFTNYEYAQGDWENTISFDVNRFLSTQFYWHLRYDTQSKRLPDTDWHRFQFKEIFSFGFSYRFKTA